MAVVNLVTRVKFCRLALFGVLLVLGLPSFAVERDCGQSLLDPGYAESSLEIDSFAEKDYRNGELLLSFFGPTGNSFHAWLKWLASNDPSHAPPEGPGLYYSGRGITVAKFAQFPFDFGRRFESDKVEEGKRLQPLLELQGFDIRNYRGDSSQAIAGRTHIHSLIDRELFGVYSSIDSNDRDYNGLNRYTTLNGDHVVHASVYGSQIVVRDTLYGQNIDPNQGRTVLDDFDKVAKVIAETDDTVIIKVSMAPTLDGLDEKGDPENENQKLIRRMFFITYWQMVQQAYRKSRLFPDEFDSAIYLLDDFIATMKSSGPNQDLYLMYDADAWNSMRRRMRLAHRYAAVYMAGAGRQPFFYQTIPDVFVPFYPVYGLTTERYPTGELEVKRLFNNSNPDPLKILENRYGPFTNGRGLNMYFYHSIANQLNPGTRLVAASKTKIHTRLYKGLGFELISSEYKEEWGTNKDFLASSREHFLESTKAK